MSCCGTGFFIATLLRYDSHAVKFIPLKVFNSVVFHIFIRICNHHRYLVLGETHYSLAVTPTSPLPPAPGIATLLYVLLFGYSGHCIYMDSYSMWGFVAGFFYLF